jgi:hypothetical protein
MSLDDAPNIRLSLLCASGPHKWPTCSVANA